MASRNTINIMKIIGGHTSIHYLMVMPTSSTISIACNERQSMWKIYLVRPSIVVKRNYFQYVAGEPIPH